MSKSTRKSTKGSKSTKVSKGSGAAKKTGRATATKSAAAKASTTRKTPRRMQPEKDPEGGLTAAGRAAFARKEGSHLRPGVKGRADTPEKQLRKGSFLRRHFANPRGPMERDGKPTRLALSAHAWGEPVPKTSSDAKKLAAKGKSLLEKYHQSQEKTKRGGKSKAR